ncbi:MAG TPA: ligase-associated DNA damage response endonuclease PdeM [Stellaceae bacterium]|nr:ligase-associated DNA damage response endonuclease PdeM [Stellaceae bacterium]
MAYAWGIAMSEPIQLRLNGADLLADGSGALYWPAESLLAVADLHLEKGSSFARSGTLLPPYDTRATLDRLEAAAARYRPGRIICLGDSFHDGDGAGRLGGEERRRLAALTARHTLYWIAGNHDPAPPAGIGGEVVAEFLDCGPLTFRHLAGPEAPAGEVSGHFHPKASLWVRERRLTGRCFLSDQRRIVLPAFGAYAGGLDARDPALVKLFPDGCAVHFIGRSRIATLPRDGLHLVS